MSASPLSPADLLQAVAGRPLADAADRLSELIDGVPELFADPRTLLPFSACITGRGNTATGRIIVTVTDRDGGEALLTIDGTIRR